MEYNSCTHADLEFPSFKVLPAGHQYYGRVPVLWKPVFSHR